MVCAIMWSPSIDYTSTNQRTTFFSKTRMTASRSADAGMNDALAVLNLPTNNALDPDILPKCHTANPDTTTAKNPTGSQPDELHLSGDLERATYGTRRRTGAATSIGTGRSGTSGRSARSRTRTRRRGNVTKRLSSTRDRGANVDPAFEQPGLELPLRRPYRQRLRSVPQQQHQRRFAHVRGRQPLPEPEREPGAIAVIVGGNLDIRTTRQ